jgi:import inner membrane translocase subunit TIM54
MDWEVIEGRKEGDVRAQLAEKIREHRKSEAEGGTSDPVTLVRRLLNVKEYDGIKGDVVIGRHTWKEYVRGLHEGWLGPLEKPEPSPLGHPLPTTADAGSTSPPATADSPATNMKPSDDASPTAPQPEEPKADDKADEQASKPKRPNPFISTSEYSTSFIPANIPDEFDPSTPLPLPHILGFLNTPKRMWRFLNRRYLADDVGRETAAIILAARRKYETSSSEEHSETTKTTCEQQDALKAEEQEWHKSVRKRVDGEPERTWLEDIVVDPRIGARMRRFELLSEEESRANRIAKGLEGIKGEGE